MFTFNLLSYRKFFPNLHYSVIKPLTDQFTRVLHVSNKLEVFTAFRVRLNLRHGQIDWQDATLFRPIEVYFSCMVSTQECSLAAGASCYVKTLKTAACNACYFGVTLLLVLFR